MKFRLFIRLLFCIIIFASCKKDVAHDIDKTLNILSDNAYIIDTSALTLVTTNSVSFDKTKFSNNINIGDIILASPSTINPNGILRKITTISQTSNIVSCSTEFASLNQAFKQLNFDSTFSDNFIYDTTYKTQSSLGINFNNNSSQINGLKLNGTLKINVLPTHLEFKKSEGEEPTKILVAANINTEGSSLSVTNNSSSAITLANEIILKKISLPPLWVTIPVGPAILIIPFSQQLEFKCLPVTVTGKASWSFLPTVSATLGAEYDGEWHNLNSFTVGGFAEALQPSNFIPTLSLNADFTFLKPVYTISPYNENLLQASFELPIKLKFVSQPTQTPNYKLWLSTELSAKIKSKIWLGNDNDFTFNIAEFPKTILEGNWDKYKLEYVSGSGQTYFPGGMPFPMIFKIKNTTTNTYIKNLDSLNLSISATAVIGYQDGEFDNFNNYCGSPSPECYGGYYYIPTNTQTPYTLIISVNLKQDGEIIDSYQVTENII